MGTFCSPICLDTLPCPAQCLDTQLPPPCQLCAEIVLGTHLQGRASALCASVIMWLCGLVGWNDIYLVWTAMQDTMNAAATQCNYFHMSSVPEPPVIKSGLCAAAVISSVVSGVAGAGYSLPRHYPFGPWPKYLLSSSNNLIEIKTFPPDE